MQSGSLFEQIKLQIDGIKELYLHQDEYFLAQDLKSFYEIPDNQKGLSIIAWKIHSEDQGSIHKLQEKNKLLVFLIKQRLLLDEFQFVDVDWQQLCTSIELEELSEQFLSLTDKIKNASANQTDLQKSLSSLNQSRDHLHQELHKVEFLENGKCPYCGQNWKDNAILEEQFMQTQVLINSVLGRENDTYSHGVEQCKELFTKQCKPRLDAVLSGLEHDIYLQVFAQFTNWQAYQNAANKCVAILTQLEITPANIDIATSLPDTLLGVTPILDQITKLEDTLSAEYHALDSKYSFAELFHDSFGERLNLEKLSVEAVEQKAEYIANQYYHSFDESLNKLQVLRGQHDELKSLCEQMKTYASVLRNAIKSYQQLVIGQIEIPFFLYSSRLLQSYQGGQGVLMKSDGKNVRFTAPGSEHDVLYTMSSGQLSAVLVAFSLALNKIYAGDTFKTVLIDDPIQCMDDINMISFVELLRREFGQSQIILSTHEDTFSNYIRYKFSKYNLPEQAITLRDV